MGNIIYIEKDAKGQDLIKPREKLNKHHQDWSTYFSKGYAEFTFDERKENLLKRSIDGYWIRVDLAQDSETKDYVGYCLSSISRNGEGEIDSIYIEEKYRSYGIGDNFMKTGAFMDGWWES